MADEKKPQASAPVQQQTAQFSGFPAEVVDVETKAKTGIYGELYVVSCKVLEGKDANRIIRRNVLGPIKRGDIIRLPDTNKEARAIKVK